MEGLETHEIVLGSVCVPWVLEVFSKFLTRLRISWARLMSSEWTSAVDAFGDPHSERERLLAPLSRERSGDLLLNERLSSDLKFKFIKHLKYFDTIFYNALQWQLYLALMSRWTSSSSSTSSSSLIEGSVIEGWPWPFSDSFGSASASYL